MWPSHVASIYNQIVACPSCPRLVTTICSTRSSSYPSSPAQELFGPRSDPMITRRNAGLGFAVTQHIVRVGAEKGVVEVRTR